MLLTQQQAIEYIRNKYGSMSPKIFKSEVMSGRIAFKQYGTRQKFRTEDLDQWYNVSDTIK